MSDAAPGPDPIYKRLYAFPAMVEDLLRSLVQEDWIARVDFQTLQKLPSGYVGDDFRQRHGDAAWRVRLRWRAYQTRSVLRKRAKPSCAAKPGRSCSSAWTPCRLKMLGAPYP